METTVVDRTVDVILVGAGPIGLELAIGLKQAGVDYLHLEAGQVGHTISWYPRQARFFSSPERIAIGGVPLLTVDQSKASREEYLTYLLSVVQQFQLPIQSYERVLQLQAPTAVAGDDFVVRTLTAAQESRSYRARKVILAIGDMHEPRPLQHPGSGPVPGCDLPHVSHYFQEPHAYAFRKLLIVGGKNSAVEAALRCHRVGAQVSLCFRQPALSDSIKYWLKPEVDSLMQSGAIRGFPGRVPIEITARDVVLARVNAQGEPQRETERIAADFVLLLIGYQMDSQLLSDAGVELRGAGRTPVVDPATMETNVPGLYIAGTASAGTQLHFRLFIENCHAHVVRILRHLTGADPTSVNPLAFTGLSQHPLSAES
jgi:thioredoxin reductase (NADPH)